MRKANGQFAKGNPGGPGNPYARKTAALRRSMLGAITESDLSAIVKAIVKKAKEGDIQASKVIFDRILGKPDRAVDPDRVDLEGRNLYSEIRRRNRLDKLDELINAD